jgi:hypothetical protein
LAFGVIQDIGDPGYGAEITAGIDVAQVQVAT